MWFFVEIADKIHISERAVYKYAVEKEIPIHSYSGSDGRYLGFGVPDDDGNRIIKGLGEKKL